MSKLFIWISSLLVVLACAGNLHAQTADTKHVLANLAYEEVVSVIGEARKLSSSTIRVRVIARGAGAIWTRSPAEARKIILDLFDYTENQTDEFFDREAARNSILQVAFSRDRELADQLLLRIKSGDTESNRRAKLSRALVDDDPGLAGLMIEESMKNGVPPTAVAALSSLRDKDSALADNIVARTIARLNDMPGPVAITGLGYLALYIYPLGTSERSASDQLRNGFFRTSYAVVKRIMAELSSAASGKELAQAMNGLPAIQLALVAAMISEMSHRYAPALVVELNSVASELLKGQSPSVRQIIHAQLANMNRFPNQAPGSNDGLELQLITALAQGDFAKAARMINEEKDQDRAKAMTELMLRAQVKYLIARSELYEALVVANKMTNREERVTAFTEIVRGALKQKDSALLGAVLSNIKSVPLSDDLKGLRVRTLYRTSADIADYLPAESLDMIREAIRVNNLLQSISDDERRKPKTLTTRVNDPEGLVESVDLTRAFSKLGQVDFETALNTANTIQHPAVRLVAKLAAAERVLSSSTPGSPQARSN